MLISTRICTCFYFLFIKCTSIRLISGPIHFVASPSENVRLRCEITEKGSSEIIWKYGSQTILSYDRQINRLLDPKLGRRYSISPSFGNIFDLSILDVKVTDIGMYTCGYIVDKTIFSLQSAKLDVIQDSTIKVYPYCYTDQSMYSITPRDIVHLNCDTGSIASPSTILTWGKDGLTLASKIGESYLSHRIIVTEQEYGVAFICKVTDLLTDKYTTCQIIVPNIIAQSIPLTVLISPPVIEAEVGTEAVFTCDAQGLERHEQPGYGWSITNNEIITSKRALLENQQKVLKIINIQYGDDRSRFTCNVNTDKRRQGSRETILYVASARVSVNIPTNDNDTGNVLPPTYAPNVNNDGMQSDQIGVKYGLIITTAVVLTVICILYIAVAFTRRRKHRSRQRSRPHEQSANSEVVVHNSATTNNGRFNFAKLFTRFNRNVSTAIPKEKRRVRFAQQETINNNK